MKWQLQKLMVCLGDLASFSSELDNHTHRLFELAMFMFMRYGDFDWEVTQEQLEKVSDILHRHETLFDEELLREVENILDDSEDEYLYNELS